MTKGDESVLQRVMTAEQFRRLAAVENPRVHEFVADAVRLCQPESVFICTDSPEEIRYMREQSVAGGEETPLRIPGHTVHFDGPEDQGRDREVTKYLVSATESLSPALKQVEREAGLAEVRGFLEGSMRGRRMIVRFLSLGPTNSVFSIPCVQCTDSFYVAHSEDLLYRPGYAQMAAGRARDFFAVLHSAGKLTDRMTSAEPDKKRIYIDYSRDTIYSVNTQYAGNSVGLKKLSLRLTIRKADREGWLAEHMFLMGVHGPGGRKTYFAGAFPSACGKTATAMLPGETILGDDIAYFRIINGEARAANAEAGIFGIIQNVNAEGDPTIYEVLTSPGEVIFSNVLVNDGTPYWLGMGKPLPESGTNFVGQWHRGMLDASGKEEVPPAHKNARYTVALRALRNVDPELDNPEGVRFRAIIYGGREASISVPVQQSFDWEHGIITFGAWLETETTFAILGREGVREFNLMSIQDFISIPLGKYIQNNLNFGRALSEPPIVFGVNYFLCTELGEFITGIRDKAVWVKWMELRVHNEVGAIRTPTGWIPEFDDLARLFKQVLGKPYTEERYTAQFSLRVPENLAKLERVEKFYRTHVPEAPPEVRKHLEAQRGRLLEARQLHGDRIPPSAFKHTRR